MSALQELQKPAASVREPALLLHSPEYSPEQIVALLAPNLEHAALCVEAAQQYTREWSERGGRGGDGCHLASMEMAVQHAQHFLRLAQGYLTQLRQQQQEQQDDGVPADVRQGTRE